MPNTDLISRADVLGLMQSYGPATYDMPYGSGDMIIRPEDVMTLPAVDAAPVAHGRWIEIETEDAYDFAGIKTWALKARCSECDFVMKFIEAHTGQYIYCPNCGARMDGGEG